MIRPELLSLAVPIASLSPYPRNPRNGDIEVIRASLRKHGQFKPVLVQAGTNYILAGNHTYMAMMEEGAESIAALALDVGDEQAARINVVDNRTAQLGGMDDGALLALLEDVGLEGTGYSPADMEKLLRDTAAAMDLSDKGVCPECQRPL